ncbi:phosphatidylinositol 4-phosphate 5-kinase 7-like isoform X1 [Pistacia vera]|uniref:phosphatidylinositol 4-phosphate 5-kinase 7-like isoform X1 n=1 Tax=Pistacia vera TaxID=55513 RepID=UPI001263279F|nr:phosphatidylinositol 4-phosphate 5-kinase 7-like isoform X1 [Pistacia vera]XP_031250064.1 phosphatidylinositol 4-phosphate 5-kinase 7-like isoform X1 [Pistacia vera]XP_031272169.1 phosphatidylinositol 4-phosphate 5-kinase 7-like isoform X1 [Pistacia vera]XP_031272170.1 phosphatidylinositol 4-phosphate 5-kinase 7-like isoform X1 [Pistacia vera]
MEESDRINEQTFSNGDSYSGDFKGILPHGKGKYTWSDGTIYEGDWEEGKMTGKGCIVWSSGAKYEGDFSGGYLHGFGTFIGPDRSVYRGTWRMNIRHGVGRKGYPNSDIYDGSWKEGVHEGNGRYSWNSGNTYIGNWKGGKMSGRGVMKWANGDIYDGSWLNGHRHGSGVYRFADGGYYFGTWSKGLKDGKGKFYPAGSKHPSVNMFSGTLGNDDSEKMILSQNSSMDSKELKTPKPRVKRSISEKIPVGGILKSSGRISHRTTSLDERSIFCDSAKGLVCNNSPCKFLHTSDEGQREEHESSTVVYEREYTQGVLIKEIVRNCAELQRKGKRQSKFSVKEVKKRSCVDIFEGHQSYYLMLNLQLGIRYTVGKITPVPMREVRASDFGDRARIRMYFPRKGSQFTPSHCSIDFYWKDYCPMVFRNLREMFKLDAAEYMMSICGDDGLRELSSPGKSGSIFYLSLDDRFVIKTLKRTELKVLLKMLYKYYIHVGEHENTLITKFFGLHRITLRGGRKVRFVVMGNMFCTELRIHRSYDLKGSTIGRSTDKVKIKENTTLKDLDLSFEFHMDKLLRESLFKQIAIDCMFLESQQIIDYSLLLGLHFRAPEHLKTLLEPPSTTSSPESVLAYDGISTQGELMIPPSGLLLVTHEPSFVSTAPGPHIRGSTLRAFSLGDKEVDLLLPGTGRLRVQLGVNMPAKANHKLLKEEVDDSMEVELFEVYDVVLYMGIIDILQEYNVKKKVEHAYKSLQFDPLKISAVEPKLYAKRFINFLKKVFPDQP